MNVAALYARAEKEEIAFRLTEAGTIKITCAHEPPPDLVAAIRQHKSELIAYLKSHAIVVQWLDAIHETDAAERQRIVQLCRADPAALDFVHREAVASGLIPVGGPRHG